MRAPIVWGLWPFLLCCCMLPAFAGFNQGGERGDPLYYSPTEERLMDMALDTLAKVNPEAAKDLREMKENNKINCGTYGPQTDNSGALALADGKPGVDGDAINVQVDVLHGGFTWDEAENDYVPGFDPDRPETCSGTEWNNLVSVLAHEWVHCTTDATQTPQPTSANKSATTDYCWEKPAYLKQIEVLKKLGEPSGFYPGPDGPTKTYIEKLEQYLARKRRAAIEELWRKGLGPPDEYLIGAGTGAGRNYFVSARNTMSEPTVVMWFIDDSMLYCSSPDWAMGVAREQPITTALDFFGIRELPQGTENSMLFIAGARDGTGVILGISITEAEVLATPLHVEIPGCEPWSLAYEPETGALYVLDGTNKTIRVVADASGDFIPDTLIPAPFATAAAWPFLENVQQLVIMEGQPGVGVAPMGFVPQDEASLTQPVTFLLDADGDGAADAMEPKRLGDFAKFAPRFAIRPNAGAASCELFGVAGAEVLLRGCDEMGAWNDEVLGTVEIGADFQAAMTLVRSLIAGEYIRLYDPINDFAGEAADDCVPPAGTNRHPIPVTPFLQHVWQTTPTGADVEIDATDSFDPDDDELTFTWQQLLDSYSDAPVVGTGPILSLHLEPGIHTFRLIADDGLENVRTYCSVAVIPNDMPAANPGGLYEVHVNQGLTLDGSGSSDPNADCGDSIVRYKWDLNGDGLYEHTAGTPDFAMSWSDIVDLVCGGAVLCDVPYPVTLCVTDSRGGTATADTTLTIRNDPPIAVDDEYTTDEDVPLMVPAPGVLANDYDPEGDALIAVLVAPPLHGEMVLNPDGSFTYTPNPDWYGDDSCDYSIGDKQGKKGLAKAYFKVGSTNDAPVILEKPLKVMYNPPELVLVKNVPWEHKDSHDLDPPTSLFNWGDGVTTPGTIVPPHSLGQAIGEHAYAACGIYTVTLTLTDTFGASDTSSGFAIISTPPVADAGGIYSTQKGARTLLPELNASASYDPDAGCGDTIIRYEWDLNFDGIYEFDDAVPLHPLTWEEIEMLVCGGLVLIDHPYPIMLQVTDSFGITDTDTATLTILNSAPEVGAITFDPPSPLPFGVTVHASAPFTDVNYGDIHTALWDWGDGSTSAGIVTEPTSPGEVEGEHAYPAPGTYTVTLTVTDDEGAAQTETAVVTVENVPPVISGIGASNNPERAGTPVQAGATFTDGNPGDAHTATWDWGDGVTTPGTVVPPHSPGLVTGEHAYATPGVYTLTLTLTDAAGESDTAVYEYVVIYDPEGGWISGHGTIESPPGAYRPDPTLTDQAKFGFTSKYKKGATIPTGTTRFQFKVADFEFFSDSYEWMVVAGAKAQYKGIGAVNGAGAYRFMLTAIDGDLLGRGKPDTFRIKIWVEATGELVYDNMLGAGDEPDPTTGISSGQIVIHK